MLYAFLFRETCIPMKMQYHIFIIRFIKNRCRRCPMLSLQRNHMFGIKGIPIIWHNRLIEQVITSYNPFILVPICKFSPKCQPLLIIIVIHKQTRQIILRIIDVRTCLSSWCGMKINPCIEFILPAPLNTVI